MTALKDANLGEEREKKIGMELKSLMDKAVAARAKVTPNKAKVKACAKFNNFSPQAKNQLGSNPDEAQKAH